MKYFLICKKTKRIKSISNGIIGYDKKKFDLKEMSFSKNEQTKLDEGHIPFYTKGKLDLKENPDMKKKKTIEDLKKELDEADDIDKLKKIIHKII